MTNDSDRYTFRPIGAFPRPGDLRRGHQAVRQGLGDLISDTECYLDVLKGVQEGFSTDERVSERGTAVGQTLDQTWVMLGVLKGALSLFPPELLARPTEGQED